MWDAFTTIIMTLNRCIQVRVKRQNQTSQILAEFLDQHDLIERVFYPGLESHPDHDVAKSLMEGYGGVISFRVNGDGALTSSFIDALKIPLIAPSLGGVDSLVEQPAIISYYDYTKEQRLAQGITDNLVRYAVGVEDVDSLRDDISQALDHIRDMQFKSGLGDVNENRC